MRSKTDTTPPVVAYNQDWRPKDKTGTYRVTMTRLKQVYQHYFMAYDLWERDGTHVARFEGWISLGDNCVNGSAPSKFSQVSGPESAGLSDRQISSLFRRWRNR